MYFILNWSLRSLKTKGLMFFEDNGVKLEQKFVWTVVISISVWMTLGNATPISVDAVRQRGFPDIVFVSATRSAAASRRSPQGVKS